MKKAGVIIGRFQVHEIHSGHMALLDCVKKIHPEKMLVLLGTSLETNQNNPLDFRTRKIMLQSLFPDIEVLPVIDFPGDDHVWSAHVDSLINVVFPNQNAILYGGRDSFIPYYHGKHETKEISFDIDETGTHIRERLAAKPLNSSDFRAGVIYGILNLKNGVLK